MNTHVFLITAKTNLHVGDESGSTFSVIDNAIQRDPLTKLPCINSSSLKGAIKEFCVHEKLSNIKKLFGSDVDEAGKTVHNNSQKGSVIFFDAKLLLMPQQNDENLFHYITCKEVIEQMNEKISLFDKNLHYKDPQTYNGRKVETVNSDVFFDSCSDDNLPIIARNVLENGESKNLWYEQILPAETVLYTIIQEEGNELKQALDGKIIQIGANATIGYGYCEFKTLK